MMGSQKTQALVCNALNGGYEIQEVELEAPRSNEALVRIVATGICHTDVSVTTVRGCS
jgi:aryl-alcohol dehydrogenase